MSKPKISIIVPVYKVEAYLGKAVESILTQTLEDFELWLVDDGSPDASGEICDDYALKDARIRVIHKENGGAPSARNMAIERAQGKYMFFMDADDWAEPTMLERLYTLAEDHQAQLVVCGFYIDTYYGADKKSFLSEKYQVDDAVYENARAFRENSYKYFDRNLLYSPWNKLFLSEYILDNGLRFPAAMWDDFPFNLSVIRNVKRVVVTTEAFYHFLRAREDSETSKYQPDMYKKREEEHGWMLELYNYWGVHTAEIREMIARRYVERVVGCLANVTCSRCTMNRKEKKAAIKEILSNPRLDKCLRYARPRSLYMKLMLVPVRMKCLPLVWLESSVITFVKEKNTKLFATLKAGR